MTSAINLAALGVGGIDTTTLVSSLVSIESQPLNQLSAQQQNIQSASSAISAFSSDLSALKSAVTALSTPGTFQSMKATSSDSSVVANTVASGSPQPGQWTVSVSQIAQAQRSLSNGTSDPTADLGMSGALTITVGTGASAKSTTISNLSGMSLNDLAGAISASGLRMQASVVYDSSSSQYRLLVSGLDTGGANSISFDESQTSFASGGFSLGLDSAVDPNYNPDSTFQGAQDAKVQVDGAKGYSVTSPTNQITNAIPGVTLAVTQPTTSPATISIASDPSSLEQSVQSFVTAYNNVVNDGHKIAGYGTQKAPLTMLQGDSAVRSSLGALEQLLGAPIPGTSGNYTTLASVGIALGNDGTLSFDQGTFESAINSDPSSVEKLFVTDPTTGATGIMNTFGSTIDSLTDPTNGVVTAEINAFTSQTQHLTTEMTAEQTRISDYQTNLQNEFARMNATLLKYKQIGNSINQSSNSSNNSNSVL
jgi:flagellar hook-associated protein 2